MEKLVIGILATAAICTPIPLRAENVPFCYAVMGGKMLDLTSLCQKSPARNTTPIQAAPAPTPAPTPVQKSELQKPVPNLTIEETESAANSYASRYCQFVKRDPVYAVSYGEGAIYQAVREKALSLGMKQKEINDLLSENGSEYQYLHPSWSGKLRIAIARECKPR